MLSLTRLRIAEEEYAMFDAAIGEAVETLRPLLASRGQRGDIPAEEQTAIIKVSLIARLGEQLQSHAWVLEIACMTLGAQCLEVVQEQAWAEGERKH